jgi:hypothetical protein
MARVVGTKGTVRSRAALRLAAHLLFSFLTGQAALVAPLDSTAEKIMTAGILQLCQYIADHVCHSAARALNRMVRGSVQYVGNASLSIFGAAFSGFWV